MRLFRFQHPRGGHLLAHVRHRGAEPRGPGRPHGQHARVVEREEDRALPRQSKRLCVKNSDCSVLL